MKVIDEIIQEVAIRSTGQKDAVRYEKYGDCVCLESDPFCGVPLGDDWLFRSATDVEAKCILEAEITGKCVVGPGLAEEIARLIAEKGYLTVDQLCQAIETADWYSYGSPSHLLSGLHYFADYKRQAVALLDVVPEDHRDGLFTSIWLRGDKEISKSLIRHFDEWVQLPQWGTSSGEGVWLGKFIAKWLTEGWFTPQRLERITEWYFKTIVMP